MWEAFAFHVKLVEAFDPNPNPVNLLDHYMNFLMT